MKLFKQISVVLLALTFAACTHQHGTNVDDTQLSQLQRGKTTYSDVVAKFGQPNSTTTSGDGSKLATYNYVKTTMSGTAFIPFAGGGHNTQINIVQFQFTPAGVLKDYTASNNAGGQ